MTLWDFADWNPWLVAFLGFLGFMLVYDGVMAYLGREERK